MPNRTTLRIAAVSDVHYGKHSSGSLNELFSAASEAADVLLLCGDLTDYGLPEEAQLLTHDLRTNVQIPILGVLGNHDFESGRAREVRQVLEDAGVVMLDGECAVVKGVGFAGACGFGGGFGRFALNAWGEALIKQFVQAALDEALKLEQALSRLQTERRIVLLHYAPIRETVEGEPLEIYPFLGSSRLEDILNRYDIEAVFHGHAHKGSPTGRTAKDIPVYNVSLPLLSHHFPDRPPFYLLEVACPQPARETTDAHG